MFFILFNLLKGVMKQFNFRNQLSLWKWNDSLWKTNFDTKWGPGFRIQSDIDRNRIQPLSQDKPDPDPNPWFFLDRIRIQKQTGSGSRIQTLENYPIILWWFLIRSGILVLKPDPDPEILGNLTQIRSQIQAKIPDPTAGSASETLLRT